MTREDGFDPRGYFAYCLWGTERDRAAVATAESFAEAHPDFFA